MPFNAGIKGRYHENPDRGRSPAAERDVSGAQAGQWRDSSGSTEGRPLTALKHAACATTTRRTAPKGPVCAGNKINLEPPAMTFKLNPAQMSAFHRRDRASFRGYSCHAGRPWLIRLTQTWNKRQGTNCAAVHPPDGDFIAFPDDARSPRSAASPPLGFAPPQGRHRQQAPGDFEYVKIET